MSRSVQYAAYMASSEWVRLRQALFDAQPVPRCYCCNRKRSGRKSFDAHHLTYDNFGRERPGDVVLVCHLCHDMIHTHATVLLDGLRAATELVRRLRRGSDRTKRPSKWVGHAVRNKNDRAKRDRFPNE